MDGQRNTPTPADLEAARKEAEAARTNPVKEATYTDRTGPTRIEYRDGELVRHEAPARTATVVREGGSLAQAIDGNSIVTDATGESMTVDKAMRMGWVAKTADGYKATPEGADLFPGFKKPVAAPAKPADADAAAANTAANTNTTETEAEAVTEAPDPLMAESPSTQEFLSAAVAVVGEAHAQAVLDAHLDGLPDLAGELVSKMELSETQKGKVGEVVVEMNAKLDAVTVDAGIAEADLPEALEWATKNRAADLRAARAAAIKGQTGPLRALAQEFAVSKNEARIERGKHGDGIVTFRKDGVLMVTLPGHGALSVKEAQKRNLIIISDGGE